MSLKTIFAALWFVWVSLSQLSLRMSGGNVVSTSPDFRNTKFLAKIALCLKTWAHSWGLATIPCVFSG